MDSKKLAQQCRELADNKKAENIVILDLRKLPGVTDFMVICSGTSEPHLRAIEEELTRKLRDEHQIRPRAVDGTRNSGWIVMDFIDVLVHVMKPDARERYNLEALWNDAPRLRVGSRKDSDAAGTTSEPADEEATETAVPRKRAKTKTKAKPKTSAEPEPKPEAKPAPKTEPEAEPKAKAKTKTKTKAKAKAKAKTKSKVDPEANPS